MKATANDYSSGTVLKPGGFNWTQDGTYTGSDRIEVAPFSLGNFQLPLSDIFRILNNGVANATEDYPLGNVPWPTSATALPQFTHFPFSLAQLCGGDISSFYGVGAETGAIYNNPNSHPGLDIFAPVGSNIYSIAGSGIVTSIGVGKIAGNLNRSGARWGGVDVIETSSNGYSVIVRHQHLYVLYGHLTEVNEAIYVGKEVNAGTLLGKIGTSSGMNAKPHLHIEIRSFGATFEDNTILAKDINGNNNVYGILALGGTPAKLIYDIAQFFLNNVDTLLSDTSSTTVITTGLGKNINDGDLVVFETTSPPSPCVDDNPQREYLAGIVGTDVEETPEGYRGFILTVPIPVVPTVEPTVVTTIP